MTIKTSYSAVILVALLACAPLGCSDVGDSSAVPEDSGAPDAADVNAPLVLDGASPGTDSAAPPDSAPSVVDAAGDDAAGPEAGGDDAAVPEAGGDDASGGDSGTDAGQDATTEAGSQDAGGEDSGSGDATVPTDSGSDTGTTTDGASGGDSGGDAGGGLVPCTTKGQTGCVKCQANDGEQGTSPNADQVCTPTEAALVAHDIASGLATAPGPDPDGSCYACAALAGCLDDSQFGDTGHECEDVAGAPGAGECEATIACILQSSCAADSVSTCYCGSAPVSGTCAAVGSSNAANGACKAVEATGLGLAATDGLDVLKSFTSTTLPAGVANNIFQCAQSNSCTACLH